MNRLLLVLLLVAALAPPAALGQTPRPLGPDEAVALALGHSRTLRAAGSQADEAAARYRELQTNRLPVVSGQGSYMRLSPNIPSFEIDLSQLPVPLPGEASLLSIPAILNRYQGVVSVQQPLFTGFRLRHSIRAAGYQAEAARDQQDATAADVALEVETAYWTLHQALALRDVVGQALLLVEAHRRDVENLQRAGMATQADLLAVQTRQSEVRLQQVEADNAVRLARLNLNHLTGLPLDTEVTPVAEVTVTPVGADLDVLAARALERRPELAAAAGQVQALGEAARAADAGRYPQLAAVANYRYARPNPYMFPQEDRFEGTWDVGFSLSVDFWNWGRTRLQGQQARARLAAAREQYDDLRERVRLDVARRLLEVQRAAEAVAVVEQAVTEAAERDRITRERFAQGVAQTSEVLDAEVALRNARTRRSQALADYAVARAALRRATDPVPMQP